MFTMKNLLRTGTGRDRAYRILRDLLRLGYLERIDRRDESGRFLEYGYRYTGASEPLTSNPQAAPQPLAQPLTVHPEAAPPPPAQPLAENPYPAEPLTENPEAAGSTSQTKQPPLTEKQEAAFQETALLLKLKAIKEEILTELKSSITALILENVTNLKDKEPSRANAEKPTKARRDGVAELAETLGLASWQKNFARVAVREEKSRTAWYYLARNHPEILRGSYSLLDKTGERGPVTWASWLPRLAEDVRAYGATRVREALDYTIAQATPKGAWGYYRARVENRPAAATKNPDTEALFEEMARLYDRGHHA